MKFGIATFATDLGVNPGVLGRAVEERSFESLFLADHTHIPVKRETPLRGNMHLPEQYSHTLDPFVALGLVAGETTTLKLGTGVCLVTERDPIVTAKDVATLDYLSAGRFLFGVGAGWNLEEMRSHGTDPAHRFRLMRERIEAMKAIWTENEASYSGKFVSFEPIHSWPKPVQKPHPPVLVGGDGEHTLKRVVRYGDGWMPTYDPDADISRRVGELQRLAGEAGREPIPVTVFSTPASAETISSFEALGVDRCVFFLNAADQDESVAWLDRRAAVADQFRRAGV